MTYVVDGHNLIGALPDIDLADPGDELELLERLRAYRAKHGGRPMIVFFDSGILPARLPVPSVPGLRVCFSAPGQPADDAIVAFLRGRARPDQYAVVTNDQELAGRVRAVGANVLSANALAAQLRRQPKAGHPAPDAASPDPHAAAFADIYAGFVEAEKARARLADAPEADFTTWVERLYGEDADEAQRAARWLGQFGGGEALEPLRDALTHTDVRVRAAALLAMGDLGDRAALPDLCDRLAHDPGSMARQAAAQSLGRLGDGSVVPALEAAAQGDPKGKVRKAARIALAQVRARHKGS